MQRLFNFWGDVSCTAAASNPFVPVANTLIDPLVFEFTQETGFGQDEQDNILPLVKVQGTTRN